MAAELEQIGGDRQADGGGKQGGKARLLTLDDLDGRTRAAQCVKDTRRDVIADLGGETRLSTLELAAVDHVSLLDAMTKDASTRWIMGEPIDPASIATLVNAFNRSAAVLGWRRRAKDVTDLTSYARQKAQSKSQEHHG